jgi:hypothetical protein
MPLHPVARQIAEYDTLSSVFTRISECGLFHETLQEYEEAMKLVHACTDEGSPQYAGAALLDEVSSDMVKAVADYHCARTVFDVLGAFHAIHQQEDGEDS